MRIGAAGRFSARAAAVRAAKRLGAVLPAAPPSKGYPPRIDGRLALYLHRRRKMNWSEIGELLDCSSYGAQLAAEREARCRGALLKRRRRTPIDAERARALRRKGMTWFAVAAKLHCSPTGASAAARRRAAQRRWK